MPRQSAIARSFAVNGSTRALIQPPADLSPAERQEFASLILGTRPDHFTPSDVPLLACYAKAIVGERIAAAELARGPVVDDKPSAWLAIWQARCRTLTTTARMLGLSPGGRVPSKSDTAREPERVSYYDRMALERRADDA